MIHDTTFGGGGFISTDLFFLAIYQSSAFSCSVLFTPAIEKLIA
jgi:hypothetical protein